MKCNCLESTDACALMSLWIPKKVHLFTLKLFVHCKKSLVVNFHCTFFCFKILVSIWKFHCKSKAILVLGFVSVNGREGRSLSIFLEFGNPRGDKPALIPTLREIHSSIVNLMWFYLEWRSCSWFTNKNRQIPLTLTSPLSHVSENYSQMHSSLQLLFWDKMKYNHKHLAENRS